MPPLLPAPATPLDVFLVVAGMARVAFAVAFLLALHPRRPLRPLALWLRLFAAVSILDGVTRYVATVHLPWLGNLATVITFGSGTVLTVWLFVIWAVENRILRRRRWTFDE